MAIRARGYCSHKILLGLSEGPIGFYILFSAHRVRVVPFRSLSANSDLTGGLQCGRRRGCVHGGGGPREVWGHVVTAVLGTPAWMCTEVR